VDTIIQADEPDDDDDIEDPYEDIEYWVCS